MFFQFITILNIKLVDFNINLLSFLYKWETNCPAKVIVSLKTKELGT